MKLKPEKVKLSVNGKVSDHAILTKSAPRSVWFTEHSAVTEQLQNGKSKKKAKAGYLSRAALAFLDAALQTIENLSELDKPAADAILHDYFLRWPLRQVTYDDGEPVILEDYEEH